MRPPMFSRDTRGNPNVPMYTNDTVGNPRVPLNRPDTRGNPNVPMYTNDTRGNPRVPMNVNDVRGLLALNQAGMQDRNGNAPAGTGGVMQRNGGDMRNQTMGTTPAFLPGYQSLLANQMVAGFGGSVPEMEGILGRMFQPTQQRQPFQITNGDVPGTGGDNQGNDPFANDPVVQNARQGKWLTNYQNQGLSPEVRAELDRLHNEQYPAWNKSGKR